MNLSTCTRRFAAATVASISVLVLAGCASMGAGTPEKIVEARSNAYWKARVAADYKTAYALSTPSYRQLRTEEQFRKKFGSGAAVKSGEATSITCEPEKCKVRIRIEASPALTGVNVGTITTHMDEIWLLEDGQWWHHQEL